MNVNKMKLVKNKSNKLHSNINKIYLYNLCHSLVFAYVIERLFWASRNMSVMDVVWIEIIYSGIVVVLELPTGMFADRFSRRTWIILDAFLSFMEFVILIFATSFWHFAVAVALSAVGHAFQSGAHNALIYDSLKVTNQENQFEKVLGRIKAVDYSGALVAGLVGAWVATKLPLVSTYWMSLVSLLLAILVSLTLQEVKGVGEDHDVWGAKDWLHIVRFMFTKKSIRFITILGMIIGAVTTYVDEFWQIYLEAVKVPVIYFGLFEVWAFGAVGIGSLLAYKHKEKLGINRTMKWMLLLVLFGLLSLWYNRSWVIVGVIGIVYYGTSVVEPLIYGYLHDHAIPKYRATIESAYSLLVMLAVMVIGVPFGYLSTTYDIFSGFLYLAVVVIIMEVIYLMISVEE